MTGRAEIFDRIKTLLNGQHFAVLATQGDEYPYCTLVGYAASSGCEEIVFATTRDTRKYQNLKKSPKVSMLVDTRTNKVADFKNAETLAALGEAREIEESMLEEPLSIYLSKHPYLKEFVIAPNCALIVIKVSKYILVNNFQNVMEYSML